jgi:Tfp pilus assembly protein PilX
VTLRSPSTSEGRAPDAPARSSRPRRTRGVALIWAIFAAMVIAGVIVSGTSTFLSVEKMSTIDFRAESQARAVAEAGLVDAYAWFRRQTTQPVTTFAPVRNLAAIPAINETDDAAIGLVRDYEILPSLWGRYEVRKPTAAETFTDSNADGLYTHGEAYTDANSNGRRDPARETRDVSTERGLSGAGAVWRIESVGTVYRRTTTGAALGTAANPRITSVRLCAEIRRLTIVPPATAAICVRTRSSVVLGNRSRVTGGAAGGLIGPTGTGTPTVSGELTGTPANGTVPTPFNDQITQVFGVSTLELKAMADGAYTDPALFPSPIGDYTLHVMEGAITFDATRPLRGTGVVVVVGNCTIAASSNSFFNGVLYVQGNLHVRAPVYLRGTVIVTGSVDIAGTGGDYSEIVRDSAMITAVLRTMGQYRFSTSPYEPATLLPDGTADENGLIRLQKSGATLPGGNLPAALGASLPP